MQPVLFWIFVAVILTVTKAYQSYLEKRKIARYGCKPGKEVHAISNLRELRKLKTGRKDFNFVRLSLRNDNTIIYKFLEKKLVLTDEPENFKAMLSTQFQEFSIGQRKRLLKPLFGKGIFVSEGEHWVHTRSLLRTQFVREKISHIHMLERHIGDLFSNIHGYKGQPFDFHKLIGLYTLTTSMDFVVGENIGPLRSVLNNNQSHQVGQLTWSDFAKSFEIAQRAWYRKASEGLAKTLLGVFKSEKLVTDSISHVHSFMYHYIDRALEMSPDQLLKMSLQDPEASQAMLFDMIRETRDREELRDLCLGVLLAARDTTSSLLGWTFYFLSRNKRVFDKLKEEISNKYGSGSNARIESMNFESLKSCVYLRYVLNETLRISTPISINTRTAKVDTTLPKGGGPDGNSPLFLSKGQQVVLSIVDLHRRKDIFGQDAEEFRPERWADIKVKAWEYLPFNGGPRICLGQQFALTEASYVVARIVQEFSSVQNAENGPIIYDLRAVLLHKNGILVTMT